MQYYRKNSEEREDRFQKELSRLLKQHQQDLLERKQKITGQLCEDDESIKKQLIELFEQWVAKVQ